MANTQGSREKDPSSIYIWDEFFIFERPQYFSILCLICLTGAKEVFFITTLPNKFGFICYNIFFFSSSVCACLVQFCLKKCRNSHAYCTDVVVSGQGSQQCNPGLLLNWSGTIILTCYNNSSQVFECFHVPCFSHLAGSHFLSNCHDKNFS